MSLTPFSASEIPVVGEPEDDYAAKAQAFAYGIQRLANEYNAEAALENAATTTTSVSNQSLTTGSKTFVVAAGLGWAAGMAGRAANTSSPLNYANFTCTSYSGTSLVVNFDSIVGSGAGITTWTIHKSSNAANAAILSSNTFTGVQNFAQGTDIAAAATVNLDTATGNTVRVTGNTQINAWTLSNGRQRTVIITGTPLLFYSATTNNLNTGTRNYQCVGGEVLRISADTGVIRVDIVPASGKLAIPAYIANPMLRQAILSAPVNTSGYTNLGGATGSTTVTAAGTITASAANGLDDRVGSITSPVFTGLSTNGTMYGYLDVNADGTCTTVTGTLAPNYRQAGADVVTNNQWTFNTGEMVGKLGNGTTASAVYRVPVGEFTVAGGVVTAITWYTIGDEINVLDASALPGVSTTRSLNHNFGIPAPFVEFRPYLKNVITQHGWAVDDILENFLTANASFGARPQTNCDRLSGTLITQNASAFTTSLKTGGIATNSLTAANWNLGGVFTRTF